MLLRCVPYIIIRRFKMFSRGFLMIAKALRRGISTELTAALRPFYFAVHPDLFGQHPVQRKVNEDSLKQLSAHMECITEHRYHLDSKELTFYIRVGKTVKRDKFKTIKIKLGQHNKDPKIIVQNLLELCNLPTDYVKSLKPEPTYDPKSFSKTHNNKSNYKPGGDYKYGSEFTGFESHFYKAKEETKKTLHSWMLENAPVARNRSIELESVKEEVSKLSKTLVKQLNLRELKYDCGWNYDHFRGCLKSLERLANLHAQHMTVLKDRTVVFASFTGVSLEGHVMLFTGDVLNNWLDFIKKIPRQDVFLKKVPRYENTLSQVLRNIRVGRRKFMPKQQAVEYAGHLVKLTTNLGDYLSRNKYPKSWPESLNEYEIVIESEAGPLMVNPTGQFIAPATCPGFMLVDFITTNMSIAKEREEKYKSQKVIERELVNQCQKQLQLKSLTKDDSIIPEKMIETLTNLINYEKDPFKNIDLHITNYYSVLTDGIVCIPWDFMSR
ncbi:T-cell activation inhibitor, mitochondrial [Teleopsis dalmanni]|uniref:T-cell activation inhibitor, mitochondrial n=1 Tax=Teleopsis dalmanni TaxID=139649 RepID=UPI0018CD1964|nr:T-cell activation inhibitor, mitochondrial [Teleopsis dalmanni]XP_037934437.1 T-cell activation inhibitor, mitochondrial [Teleopsis dalmanni]